ncbi:uncharacterized protein QC763_0105040 [Podospora pseudopauciseta]|uniref:Uncharacterized protein n=1 Tax=Podospora pseudopauciseta TaxID=2093780 RepID=A0ABR0H166_9PEZI|nr:hypothetical protein QC763_0105040 [Podospora pseudopauciseta]
MGRRSKFYGASITLSPAPTAGDLSTGDREFQKSHGEQGPASRNHASAGNSKDNGAIRPVAGLYKEYLESREPAANHTFHDIKDGIVSLRPLSVTFGGMRHNDPQFMGEYMVSEYLPRSLGDGYQPTKHWKSPLRVGAGHPAPEQDAKPAATFVVTDVSNKLRSSLFEDVDQRLKILAVQVTFHLSVYRSAM